MIPNKIKILILEDEEADAELTKLYASSLEYDCEFCLAKNEKEYITCLEEDNPNLVISDYKLIGYDGVQALEYLQKVAPWIPFIMVTGTLGEELAVKIIKLGAADFLLKKNIASLPNSIIRVFRELAEKREKEEAQKQLAISYRNMLEAQSKLLSVQINPHFLFNVLSSMQANILEENTEMALELLDSFSQLVRTTLENSREDVVSLEQEIAFLDLYLTTEQKRMRGAFDFSFNVDDNIDPEFTYVPPMILQPFAENAIIHGIAPLDKQGKIEIRFRVKDGKKLVSEIVDNGIGFTNSIKQKEDNGPSIVIKKSSLGMDITSSRLTILGEIHNEDFEQTVEDRLDDKGNVIGTIARLIMTYDAE